LPPSFLFEEPDFEKKLVNPPLLLVELEGVDAPVLFSVLDDVLGEKKLLTFFSFLGLEIDVSGRFLESFLFLLGDLR